MSQASVDIALRETVFPIAEREDYVDFPVAEQADYIDLGRLTAAE